ncbi:MAG: TonB-dependent receptor, partial [Myxococcales bacterium]|nr:TonB-dependent receptor [Myxococcales bacterium]
DLEDFYGPFIGFVIPAQTLTDRILDFPWAIGFGAYMPGESVFVERAYRPDKLFSVDYQERPFGVGVAVALGVRIHPTLTVGVGATVAVSVPTLANSLGTLDAQQFTSTDVDTQISPKLTLGFQWKPTDRLSIGASYIQQQQLNVRGTANVTFAIAAGYPFIPPVPIPGLGPFETPIRFFTTYVPALVTMGAAYRFTERLQVEAALQWQRWSTYHTTTNVQPPNKFDDVWSPRVGLEYHVTPDFALRAGFKYEPTPVTEQPTGFNLLGADKFIPSAGFGWTFKDPMGIFKKPMSLDFSAFYHYLKERTFDTGTGGPPFDQLAPLDLLTLILLVPNFQGAVDVDEPHRFRGGVLGFTMSLTTYF